LAARLADHLVQGNALREIEEDLPLPMTAPAST
jgi:hypothetical protein